MRTPDFFHSDSKVRTTRPKGRLGDLRWCVTSLAGHRLPPGSTRVTHLATVLYQVEETFGAGCLQYDKVYRGLRKLGAFCQVVTLPAAYGFAVPQLVVLTIAPAVER